MLTPCNMREHRAARSMEKIAPIFLTRKLSKEEEFKFIVMMLKINLRRRNRDP